MQSAEWYRERMKYPSLCEADKTAVREDWEKLTGEPFSASFRLRCPNCYHDAIILILRKMDKKNNGGYELKSGVAFRYKGKVYSKLNITAEAAEWWIRQDLKHRDDFVTLAKDYDEYERKSTTVE